MLYTSNIIFACQYNNKMIVSVAAIKTSRLYSTNIKQTYIESVEELQREIDVWPNKDVGLEFKKVSRLRNLCMVRPKVKSTGAGL